MTTSEGMLGLEPMHLSGVLNEAIQNAVSAGEHIPGAERVLEILLSWHRPDRVSRNEVNCSECAALNESGRSPWPCNYVKMMLWHLELDDE